MADRRYVDETGTEWASEFEYRVFEGLQLLGYDVRKCGEGDSFDYTSTVTRGNCLECGSSRVGQRRTYTPDLYVSDLPGPNGPEGRYIEAKGYWPAHKRNLLRSAIRSNPDTHLVFVFQVDRKATAKQSYSAYATKYFPGSSVAVYPWSRGIKKQETLDKKLEIFRANILAFSGGQEK